LENRLLFLSMRLSARVTDKAKKSLSILLTVLVGGVLFAQTIDPEKPASEFPPTATLVRKDKTIIAIKYSADGDGLFVICSPKDEDKEKITKFVIYDVKPYLVHITIDKNIIKAPLAFVRQKDGGDGELEAYNATANLLEADDAPCLPEIKPDPKPNTVFVTQGKTQLTGSRLDYSQETGLAVIAGPITFERPQDSGDVLRGNSEKITVNVDEEKTFLEGKVILKSKCRESSADRVEYDDKKNRAILEGKPARSTGADGSEVVGQRLEYNLETNDVIVTSSDEANPVTGTFDDEAAPCK
jgi:lipopolysaccharide export system protein LptA